MWLILQHDHPDDFVIATGQIHSVTELCEASFSQAGLNWKNYVVVNPEFVRPTETGPLVGDYSKIRKTLGWKPKTTFKQLVEMMVTADISRLS
jgi:GDPmannose 4,6-dehydratase